MLKSLGLRGLLFSAVVACLIATVAAMTEADSQSVRARPAAQPNPLAAESRAAQVTPSGTAEAIDQLAEDRLGPKPAAMESNRLATLTAQSNQHRTEMDEARRIAQVHLTQGRAAAAAALKASRDSASN